MLLSLKITNFALIDYLELEFQSGLNILTGETGAGKSIILDALDAVLGGKVSAKVIRTGAERAILEAAFVLSADLIAWLNQEEIELLEEPTLLCSREITAKSTRTRVNGVVINRQQSQALREMLVEITAQGQTILLSRSDAQRDWLDSFGGAALWQQRQIVAELYAQKERSHRLWQERQQNERQRLQHLDMLRYQLRELENAHLVDPHELEQLEAERLRLAHGVDLQEQSFNVYEALYQNDQNKAGADLLGQAERVLTGMAEIDPQVLPILELVSSALAQVEEAGRQIRAYGDDLESNPEDLEQVEQRIGQIKQICRKYGSSLPEVIDYLGKLHRELAAIDQEDQSIEALEQQAQADLLALQAACDQLTALRRTAAMALEAAQIQALQALAMEKVGFRVGIYATTPNSHGADRIVFEFSPNLGEPLQPLADTASGGEMSRFLLALKSSLKTNSINNSSSKSNSLKNNSFKNNPPKNRKPSINPINDRSMVFDEIDVGVSGRVAQAIALQLWQLSQQSQVLCVTHQPIVAAIADHHFQVRKQIIWEQQGDTTQERTHIEVKALSDEERKQELAQIASGVAAGQDLDRMLPNFEIVTNDAISPPKSGKSGSKNTSKESTSKPTNPTQTATKQATATQAIAFAESLLHQAAELKSQLRAKVKQK
jgi:DNA repair protein RecN (Recombination protein N)